MGNGVRVQKEPKQSSVSWMEERKSPEDRGHICALVPRTESGT